MKKKLLKNEKTMKEVLKLSATALMGALMLSAGGYSLAMKRAGGRLDEESDCKMMRFDSEESDSEWKELYSEVEEADSDSDELVDLFEAKMVKFVPADLDGKIENDDQMDDTDASLSSILRGDQFRCVDENGSLRMKVRGLDTSQRDQFFSWLKINTLVSDLDLSSNGLGGAGAFSLAEALAANRQLKELSVSGNNIGNDGAIALLSVVVDREMETVDLSSNELDEEVLDKLKKLVDAKVLVELRKLTNDRFYSTLKKYILKKFKKWQKTEDEVETYKLQRQIFDMFECYLSCSELVREAYWNIHVINLILENNRIGDRGAKVLADIIGEDCLIQELSVQRNFIGNAGVVALGDAIKYNHMLISLDLSNNFISCEEAKILAEMLKENTTLTKLNLSSCPIQDEGAKYFADMLIENSTLMSLDLQRDDIGVDGVSCLSDALKHNSSLTRLSLRSNEIRTKGFRSIGDMLKVNSSLVSLDLNGDICNVRIGDGGFKSLADGIAQNSALTELDLSNRVMIWDDFVCLEKALKKNVTLTSLDMDRSIDEMKSDSYETNEDSKENSEEFDELMSD